MLGITDYGAFCATILLFLALPGPGTFALLTSTGKGGFRGGAAATLGLIVGDQVLLWLAVAGVAALLAANLKASLRAIVARTRCSSYHESQDCYDIAVAALKEKT